MDATPVFAPPTLKHDPPVSPLHPGDLCPQCGQGKLDYNGILLLACEACGYVVGEGGGCT
ncbi:MAG: hypothetical protein ACOYYS_28190 [Chloroflexota bacterium]